MFKKAVILFCAMVLLLTSCNYDPYSGKRPSDYGEASWICDTDVYKIWFTVNMDQYDYWYPEGILQLRDETYFCKFYFNPQTNQLSISVYPLEYRDLPDDRRDRNRILADLYGDCDFSSDSFRVRVDKKRDTTFNGAVDELTFVRKNLKIE